MKTYLIARLREPSTWRGIILLATSSGATIAPAMADQIVAIGIGVAGLVAVACADKIDPERTESDSGN